MIMCGILGGTIRVCVHGSSVRTFCATFDMIVCYIITFTFCAIINDSFDCDADGEYFKCVRIVQKHRSPTNLDYLYIRTKMNFMLKTNMPRN